MMRSTQARATLAAMAMLCWGQLAVAQITSLEVLVLDSPPFTCSDAAPCYSTGSLRTDGFEGCRAGSRRTKNGVCVHGLSVELLNLLERRIRKQAWADPAFTLNLFWRSAASVGGYTGEVRVVRVLSIPPSLSPSLLCARTQSLTQRHAGVAAEISMPGTAAKAGFLTRCLDRSAGCYPTAVGMFKASVEAYNNSALCGEAHCDLAAVDMSITWQRKSDCGIEFSAPFFDSGMVVVARYHHVGDSVSFEALWARGFSLTKAFSLEVCSRSLGPAVAI